MRGQVRRKDPEGRSVGAEVSPRWTPAPWKTPQVVVGGTKAAPPTEAAHQGERTLETALGILEHIHALHLQALHDVGGEGVGAGCSSHTHG